MRMRSSNRYSGSRRQRQYCVPRRHRNRRVPLVDIRQLRPPRLRRMHQHITPEHRPRSHHALMPRRVPRRRQQPHHTVERHLSVHRPQLPSISKRPNQPLIRRRPPRMLHLSLLHHIRRVREPRYSRGHIPPRVIQVDVRQHHSVDLRSRHPSRLEQRRQPPSRPQPLSRLPSSRPDPRINQHNPSRRSHQVTMKMQPPPTISRHIPRRSPHRPLLLRSRPPRQRGLHLLRKHRHRITQDRHVHPNPPFRP